jgi:hypothetical protein
MRRCAVALSVVALLASSACGSTGRTRPDYGPFTEEDVFEETLDPDAPRVTIQDPKENALLSGTVSVKIVLTDPKVKGFASLKLSILAQGAKKPVEVASYDTLDGKPITTSFETKGVFPDGTHTFIATAETKDGRTGTASVAITTDNSGPVITAESPTPEDGGRFVGDLQLRFVFEDTVGLVKDALVTADDKSAWSPSDATARARIDTGTVTISTADWAKPAGAESAVRDVVLHAEATDRAGNASALDVTVTFVPAPRFDETESAVLPDDMKAASIGALRLRPDNTWVVAAVAATESGKTGILLYGREKASTLKKVKEITTAATGRLKVADMDGNGTDDIVALSRDETKKESRLTIYLQDDTGAFAKASEVVSESLVNDYALGDVKPGGSPAAGRLDIAIAFAGEVDSVGLSLASIDGEGKPAWGAISTYGGVPSPTLVAIGDFTDDGQNDVVVAATGSEVVTVFPGTATGISGGLNAPLVWKNAPAASLAAIATWKHKTKGWRAVFSDAGLRKILRTVGAGTDLLAEAAFPTGTEPVRLVLGDVNNDQNLDAVVLCTGSAMALVYWGDSDGEFVAGPAMFTGGDPTVFPALVPLDVALADLTGDGFLDLVVLDGSRGRLSFLPYTGETSIARRFAGQAMVRLDLAPGAIGAGVFTLAPDPERRILDAVVTGPDALQKDQILVIASDPDAGLPLLTDTSPIASPVPLPNGVKVANLDKKGLDDIVVSSSAVDADKTIGIVLFKAGSEHLVVVPDTSNSFDGGNLPGKILVADVDQGTVGSGKKDVLDLVVLAQGGDGLPALGEFIGNGDGSFTQRALSFKFNEMTVTDMLLEQLTDENYDLVLATAEGDFTVVPGWYGLFQATQAVPHAAGKNPRAIASGYLDGKSATPADLYPDIVVLLETSVSVAYSVNGESFLATQVIAPTTAGSLKLAVTDMNLDDYPDVVVLDAASEKLSIYLNLSGRKFHSGYHFHTGVGPADMTIADLDGDGCPDVATADRKGNSITYLKSTLCGE